MEQNNHNPVAQRIGLAIFGIFLAVTLGALIYAAAGGDLSGSQSCGYAGGGLECPEERPEPEFRP